MLVLRYESPKYLFNITIKLMKCYYRQRKIDVSTGNVQEFMSAISHIPSSILVNQYYWRHIIYSLLIKVIIICY